MLPKSKRLTYEVADKIMVYLARISVQPGDKIPSEKNWVKTTGASRSCVREALHILVGMGLLEVYPGRGYFLKNRITEPFTERRTCSEIPLDLDKLIEMRRIVEVPAASLAAQRGSHSAFDDLEMSLAKTRDLVANRESIYEHLLEFHRAIVVISGNVHLVDTMDLVIIPALMGLKEALSFDFPGRELIDLEVHQDLITSLRKNDASIASEAMDRHILHALQIYKLASDLSFTEE